MYIEPNTTVKILKDCPLNSKYEHTIFFGNETQQRLYFQSLTKYTLEHMSYQRVQKGKMRVAVKAEDLYDCNYLMFQNASFGNRWFYAFIKSVEYVNNVTSEITFEIDVMQTWFFDYHLNECFVEREHAMDDSIGANTVPENLELGEYISEGIDKTGLLGTAMSVVVASTFKYNSDTNELEEFHGGVYSGIYSGVYFNVFNLNTRPPGATNYNGVEELNNFLQRASEAGKDDGIVSVFMMPSCMINMLDEASQEAGEMSANVFYDLSRTKLINYSDYNVVNNKLFTYPYNFFYVSNMQGTGCAFPYEFFGHPTHVTFRLTGDFNCNPGLILYPLDYKGVEHNLDEKITLTGYPKCAYSIDSFKSWLAQNGVSMAVSGITSIGSSAVSGYVFGGVPGALISGGVTAISQILSAGSTLYEKSIMPRHSGGSSGSTTLAANGMLDFIFMKKHIKPEYAKIIDNYFSMFGYATHRVKIPNRDGRRYWNYVKTRGATVIGSVPADDMDKIASIYDNGITFWKNGNNVGDYSLNNIIE